MNHLSDELINKYIDNELDLNELKLIDDHLKGCSGCSMKLKAHRLVDIKLKQLDTPGVPDNFTFRVMEALKTASPAVSKRTEKNYLPRSIFAFFAMIIAAILGFVTYSIFSIEDDGQLSGLFDKTAEGSAMVFSTYMKLMQSQAFSVISGSVILILFLGLYFIHESHKNFRNRLNNFK